MAGNVECVLYNSPQISPENLDQKQTFGDVLRRIGLVLQWGFSGDRMKRIRNLTGVRAIAALWVVMYHTDIGFASRRLAAIVGSGWMGVDIFYVLSGLVLSIVYVSKLPATFNWSWYRNFLSRRIAKIYPLHIITFCISALLILTARHVHYQFVAKSENTVWSAICNILMLHSLGLTHLTSWNSPSWSVSAEWIAYSIIFAPMVFALRRVPIMYVAALVAGLWTSLFLLSVYLFKISIGEMMTDGVLRIIPEFVAGYLLFRLLQARIFRWGDLDTGAGILLVLAAALFGASYVWLLLPGVMILLAGLYTGGPISDRLFGNKGMVLIGNASYSIYLVQGFILIAAHQIVRRMHLPANVLAFFLEIGCVVLAGLLTFHSIEEPLRLALLRRFSRSLPAGHLEIRLQPDLRIRKPDARASSTIA